MAYRRDAAESAAGIESGLAALNLTPTVFVIHHEMSTRESLESLVCRRGWKSTTYSHASAFLAHDRMFVPGCLILDLNLADDSALDVQRLLLGRPELPIIFVSDSRSIEAAILAMKAGAFEFLVEPFTDQEISNAIELAVERSAAILRQEAATGTPSRRYSTLTQRERRVMELLILGQRNKEVAGELGITEMTVKVHRSKIMRKMRAESFAELVRLSLMLQTDTARATPARAAAAFLSERAVDRPLLAPRYEGRGRRMEYGSAA